MLAGKTIFHKTGDFPSVYALPVTPLQVQKMACPARLCQRGCFAQDIKSVQHVPQEDMAAAQSSELQEAQAEISRLNAQLAAAKAAVANGGAAQEKVCFCRRAD